MFKRGMPSVGVEVAWLLLGDSEGERTVELCAHDGEQWCGAGDWRGESTRDPIADDGLAIVGWKEYEIPEPVLGPLLEFCVYEEGGRFLGGVVTDDPANVLSKAVDSGLIGAATARLGNPLIAASHQELSDRNARE